MKTKIITAAIAAMVLIPLAGCTSDTNTTSPAKSVAPITTPVNSVEELDRKVEEALATAKTAQEKKEAAEIRELLVEGAEICNSGTLKGKPVTREHQAKTCLSLPGLKYMIIEML